MKTVCIAWNNNGHYLSDSNASRAIEMSRWCKELGLQMDRDFDWFFNQGQQETYFRFFNEAEMYATMFALKWVGNEISSSN